MKPSDITLIKTCDACPEQYDAYNTITNESTTYPLGYGEFTESERDGYLNGAKEFLCIDYNDSHRHPTGEYTEE